MLDDRKSLVLQALVEEYIRTGEPVSSQAVLDRSGLEVSSATIRNDIAKLKSYGFVTQPHTSAGRVPTHQGYRYYVDHCSPGRLRNATRARIESFFTDVHRELARLLKDTSGLLSDITHYPAVVIGPGIGGDRIDGVHLVRLGGSGVLVVVVAESGRVTQQIVDLGFEPSDRQLDEAERIVEAACVGSTVPEATERLTAVDVTDVVRRIVDPIDGSIRQAGEETGQIYVGGTSQLAELWNDLAIVQNMLGLLEQENSLMQMLAEGEGTNVRIGAELGDDLDLAVVSSSFDTPGGAHGRVGVIGPMRMDYRRTIRVVEEVGEGLGESLGTDR